MVTEPLTYSVKEAAKVLGVGRASAYELVRTGRLPHIQIGRRMLISRAVLREFLGLLPDENALAQSQGKDADREKAGEEEETTYVVTIRRVVKPAPQPAFRL